MRARRRPNTIRWILGLGLLVVLLAVPLDLFLLSRDARAVWMRDLPSGPRRLLAGFLPGDPAMQYALGVRELESGNYQGAGRALKRAVDLDPGFLAARAQYANVLVDLEHYHEAGALVQECLLSGGRSEDGDDSYRQTAPALVARGRMYCAGEDWGKAWRDAEQARSLQPDSPDVWLLEAQVLEAMGAWKETEEAAGRVVRLRPALWKGWSLLAAAARRQGDPVESLWRAERAVQLDPRSAGAQAGLAEALLAGGKPQDLIRAQGAVEEAIRLEPQNLPARVALGDVRLRQGRWREAQPALLESVRIWPEGNEARALLARACEMAEQPDAARRWRGEHARWDGLLKEKRALWAGLRQSEYDSPVHFALARLYVRMGLWDRARVEADRGLHRGPDPAGLALRREIERRRLGARERPGALPQASPDLRVSEQKEAAAPGGISPTVERR